MVDLVSKILANRYRVDTFIGRGGMAEVYKVWDSKRMTFLAMKLLHEDLAIDRVFMRRFQREAQTLAKLQHPNIVRFYGLEQEGRLAYILLDFINGENLKHKIFDAADPMPLDEIRRVLRSICGALSFAHSEGLVHCDIKPANIMFHQNGGVLLSDFGIARMTDAATATMVGMGTPAYMAPELIRGHDPTSQVDIYSLGIVLYEMLTGGERPFTGEHAHTTGSTSEKVRWEQINLPPPSPRKWNMDISVDVERVILKCLEKDPGKRFENALDFLNALGGPLDETGKQKATILKSPDEAYFIEKQPDNIHDDAEPIPESPPATRRSLIPWFVAGGIGIILIISWLLTSLVKPKPPDPSLIAHIIQQTQTAVSLSALPLNSPTLTNTHTPTLTPETAVVYTKELDRPTTAAPVDETVIIDDITLDILDDSPSPTDTLAPSLTATEKPSQTPSYTIINVNDPIQFIQVYYAAIIRGEFEYTFSLLTDNFKSKYHDVDKDGDYEFSPYAEWWDNFSKIDLLRTELQQQSSNQARVLILGRFYYKDGRVDDDQQIFHLISDGHGGWLIDDVGG